MSLGRRDPGLGSLPKRRAPSPLREDNSSENGGHRRFAGNDNRQRKKPPGHRGCLGDTPGTTSYPPPDPASLPHSDRAGLFLTSPPRVSETPRNRFGGTSDVHVTSN